MMRRWISLVVFSGVVLIAAGAHRSGVSARGPAPKQTEATRTGWISDQACGASHMKEGGASCVRKCWRGGAAVGHPEWKPQKAVFVADEDHAAWAVENMDAVKEFASEHITVTGKFDPEKKTILVETVAPIAK